MLGVELTRNTGLHQSTVQINLVAPFSLPLGEAREDKLSKFFMCSAKVKVRVRVGQLDTLFVNEHPDFVFAHSRPRSAGHRCTVK